MNKILLKIDGIINLALGVLLTVYPKSIINILGLPIVEVPFYASILGAVLFGIGIALFLQINNPSAGLGLGGAIAINLCGGLCLAGWLLFGDLNIPDVGFYIMWSLVLILVGISTFELFSINKKHNN